MKVKSHYQRDLDLAEAALIELVARREEAEVQIAKTKTKISLLKQLMSGEVEPPDFELGGLSSSVRVALRASTPEWLSAAELLKALRDLGFPLDKYRSPLAAISTTVARMVGEEVETKRDPNSESMVYRWAGSNWGAPGSLRNRMADAEQYAAMMRRAAKISQEATKRRRQKP